MSGLGDGLLGKPRMCNPCATYYLASHTCDRPTEPDKCPCEREHRNIDTQQEAFRASRGSASKARVKITAELKVASVGLLCEEFLVLHPEVHRTTASGEFARMRKEGLIRAIGTRRTPRGKQAKVWVLVERPEDGR